MKKCITKLLLSSIFCFFCLESQSQILNAVTKMKEKENNKTYGITAEKDYDIEGVTNAIVNNNIVVPTISGSLSNSVKSSGFFISSKFYAFNGNLVNPLTNAKDSGASVLLIPELSSWGVNLSPNLVLTNAKNKFQFGFIGSVDFMSKKIITESDTVLKKAAIKPNTLLAQIGAAFAIENFAAFDLVYNYNSVLTSNRDFKTFYGKNVNTNYSYLSGNVQFKFFTGVNDEKVGNDNKKSLNLDLGFIVMNSDLNELMPGYRGDKIIPIVRIGFAYNFFK